MTVKEQWNKIKDNWIFIVLIVVAFLFMSAGGVQEIGSFSNMAGMSMDMAYEEKYMRSQGDFAPEAEERKITKTASISTETKRGEFLSAQQNLKNMISASDSFILNENVNKYGTQKRMYYQGSYQIKVDTNKYEALVSQLKTIGEVQSFNENTNDITGRYENAQINLEVERSRLLRYEQMYSEARDIGDKIELNDRIFDQERTVKYLEDSIERLDQRVDYTSISFSMTEKRSSYANVVFVKFSSLIRNLVDSVNLLLSFVFSILPWAVFLGVIALIWKFFKKRK